MLNMVDNIGIHRVDRVEIARNVGTHGTYYWLKCFDDKGQEFCVTIFGEPTWDLRELPPELVTLRDGVLEDE